jgi:hypothetical protein
MTEDGADEGRQGMDPDADPIQALTGRETEIM